MEDNKKKKKKNTLSTLIFNIQGNAYEKENTTIQERDSVEEKNWIVDIIISEKCLIDLSSLSECVKIEIGNWQIV